jgi:SLOG cluster3 family/TIR domain
MTKAKRDQAWVNICEEIEKAVKAAANPVGRSSEIPPIVRAPPVVVPAVGPRPDPQAIPAPRLFQGDLAKPQTASARSTDHLRGEAGTRTRSGLTQSAAAQLDEWMSRARGAGNERRGMYRLYVVHRGSTGLVEELINHLLSKLQNLHFDPAKLEILVNQMVDPGDYIALGLYFGSNAASTDPECREQIESLKKASIPVVPLVVAGADFQEFVPNSLHPINALDRSSLVKASTAVLHLLGLTEKHRRVFVSYQRSDSLLIGEQLWETLGKAGFSAFLDSFSFDPDVEYRERLSEVLGDKAFLLVVESPSATTSKWAEYEVEYARKSRMGLLALTWPGSAAMRNVFDKQRIYLSESDQLEKTADVVRLTSNFLSMLPDLVERAHAKAMLARRRQIMGSLECELRRREIQYQLVSDWTLLAKVARSEEQLFSITPRPFETRDLFLSDTNLKLALVNEDQIVQMMENICRPNAPHQQLTTPPHLHLLGGCRVFLSASFPNRSASHFFETADPDEITHAIVATCRAVFAAGGQLVVESNPSVTPLVIMIAEEYLRVRLRDESPSVIVYQSEFSRWTMLDQHRVEWADFLAVYQSDEALHSMRATMFRDQSPVAGIFIGGMEDIYDEAALFRELCCGRALYFVGAPGGATQELAENEPLEFTAASGLSTRELSLNCYYPALLQRIVLDIAERFEDRHDWP